MPSPATITAGQLIKLIGTPNAPALIDLRIDEDFATYPWFIPGSRRFPFQHIAELAADFRNQRVVAICHKGKKISQGAAALLRSLDVHCEVLQGGFVAWLEAKHPTVDLQSLPTLNEQQPSLWVTRHRPKVDRIACPWLIRRFVDTNARFLFVEPSEVLNVADRFDAIAFDVDGADFTHKGGYCSFDALLDRLQLTIPALSHLAAIIRGADTGDHKLAEQSAGLLAISLGLSRMYKDDSQQLEAGLLVYDALYRWCRDATNEQHNAAMHTNRVDPGVNDKDGENSCG